MATGLTLDVLKRETGVTDTQLNCEVQEKHLLRLANHFGNCEKYLGDPGLDLTEAQKADVKRFSREESTQIGTFKALELWKKKNPFRATYRALIEILLDFNEGILVIKVCKLIVENKADLDLSQSIGAKQSQVSSSTAAAFQQQQKQIEQLSGELKFLKLQIGRTQPQEEGAHQPQGSQQSVAPVLKKGSTPGFLKSLEPIFGKYRGELPAATNSPYPQQYPSRSMVPSSITFNWRKCKDIPRHMRVFRLPVALNGKMYALGESRGTRTVIEYTPDCDQWSELPPLPLSHFTVAAFKSQLLVVGGLNKFSGQADAILKFNEESRKWVHFHRLPGALLDAVAIGYQDHLIVVASGGPRSSEVIILDTIKRRREWIPAEPLRTTDTCAYKCDTYNPVIIKDTVYLVGEKTKTVLRAHIPALIQGRYDVWESLPNAPLFWSSPFTKDGRLFTVGGRDTYYGYDDVLTPLPIDHDSEAKRPTTIQLLDQRDKQWTRVGDLPEPMGPPCFCVELSGQLFVLGSNRHFYTSVHVPTSAQFSYTMEDMDSFA